MIRENVEPRSLVTIFGTGKPSIRYSTEMVDLSTQKTPPQASRYDSDPRREHIVNDVLPVQPHSGELEGAVREVLASMDYDFACLDELVAAGKSSDISPAIREQFALSVGDILRTFRVRRELNNATRSQLLGLRDAVVSQESHNAAVKAGQIASSHSSELEQMAVSYRETAIGANSEADIALEQLDSLLAKFDVICEEVQREDGYLAKHSAHVEALSIAHYWLQDAIERNKGLAFVQGRQEDIESKEQKYDVLVNSIYTEILKPLLETRTSAVKAQVAAFHREGARTPYAQLELLLDEFELVVERATQLAHIESAGQKRGVDASDKALSGPVVDSSDIRAMVAIDQKENPKRVSTLLDGVSTIVTARQKIMAREIVLQAASHLAEVTNSAQAVQANTVNSTDAMRNGAANSLLDGYVARTELENAFAVHQRALEGASAELERGLRIGGIGAAAMATAEGVALDKMYEVQHLSAMLAGLAERVKTEFEYNRSSLGYACRLLPAQTGDETWQEANRAVEQGDYSRLTSLIEGALQVLAEIPKSSHTESADCNNATATLTELRAVVEAAGKKSLEVEGATHKLTELQTVVAQARQRLIGSLEECRHAGAQQLLDACHYVDRIRTRKADSAVAGDIDGRVYARQVGAQPLGELTTGERAGTRSAVQGALGQLLTKFDTIIRTSLTDPGQTILR